MVNLNIDVAKLYLRNTISELEGDERFRLVESVLDLIPENKGFEVCALAKRILEDNNTRSGVKVLD